MNKNNLLVLALLTGICILSFFLAIMPHINYKFFLHEDEWFHAGVAKNIVNGNFFVDPATNSKFLNLEPAWHLLLAFFALILKFLNFPLINMVYLPAFFHVLAVLSVFLFVSKLFGKMKALIAAVLVAIIPSNIAFGGPIFLKPTNLSLIFIPLALFFAFELSNFKKIYNFIFLLLITLFLAFAHPPTAIILFFALFVYGIFNWKEKKKALSIFFVILITIISLIVFHFSHLDKIRLNLSELSFLWASIDKIISYNFIFTIFFVAGFFLLARESTKRKEIWCLLVTASFLLAIIFLATLGIIFVLPFHRVYIPLFLLMAIISSNGIGFVYEFSKRKSKLISLVILFVILLSIFLIFFVNLPPMLNLPESSEEYKNFLWIKENIPEDKIVLIDPRKARAFNFITERKVFAASFFDPNPEFERRYLEAINFLQNNCKDIEFLLKNNISVVYSERCENSLTKIHNKTYLVS